MNRQSLFDLLETYTIEEFTDIIAEKTAKKINVTHLRREKKGGNQNMKESYYKTSDLSHMFKVPIRKVTMFASLGSRIFPDYVKIFNSGKGKNKGYFLEKTGVDRLYKENPYFFDDTSFPQIPSESEARS
ncbi:MAG: hypothetical protein IJ822_04350 [Pyramidobacter sp.]|nr:hypothetical protein [Pyramidobacter sp.]MBQ8129429.1 hypothetical protein [Clostridia bacterium]MBR1895991.1 hypothetical protein [Pyramidobacter sp.]